MASSSNPVGTYSEEAKIAIQKMLGIYEAPWELIREDTFTNATEADHIVTADANGQAFALTDVIFQFETPKQSTASAKGNYGQVRFWYGSASANYYAVEPGAWTQEADATAHGFNVIIEQRNGMMFVGSTGNVLSSNSGNFRFRYNTNLNDYVSQGKFMPLAERIISKIEIRGVLGTGHYKLYGKRKVV